MSKDLGIPSSNQSQREQIVKSHLVRALRLAKEAWAEAELPPFVTCYAVDDTGRIALAILAVKVYGEIK
ncbi:MAG: hypothetical protein HYT12_01270 [Candidatus Liptonbacteria bacterium]|nr:hypothetical protein [Candidatus Liptonbacteria bacterium]